MRRTYLVVGIAALVILIGGVYASNKSSVGTPAAVSSGDTIAMTLSLTSPAFADGASIPSTYTCDGNGSLSPALVIAGVPESAKSLTLIVDDPDVPKQIKPDGVYDHWVLFNIAPDIGGISEGGSAGVPGANGSGRLAYTGPCPPTQYEPSEHRYLFRLYALDAELSLGRGASKDEVLGAMEGHILEQTLLTGRYKRQ